MASLKNRNDTSAQPAGRSSDQPGGEFPFQDEESWPKRAESRHLPQGHLLQERYRILKALAVGGMSTVYKARDLRFANVKRFCAVKEMVNTANDPERRTLIVRNFEREANILATLNHPGIVQVYDYFTEGDRSYLVLEYVQGKNLETIMAHVDDFLPEEQVVEWALQICDVLRYLHNHDPQPIVFRDVKPSNIMLDAHNRVKMVDFGIAKLFEAGQKGTMIGTEGYAPPEQYRGVAEPRVDIYALGATMHHLLSKQDPRRQPPFSFHERPLSDINPRVSRQLEEIVDKALAYDIDDRYQSIEALQQDLVNLRSNSTSATVHFGQPATTSSGSDIMALWRFACEDEVRSSPTLNRGVLYVGAYDHNLYALDAEDGEFLWKHATDGGIGASPLVYKGYVLFGSADRIFYAVDARSGRLQWTCPTEGPIWASARGTFDHAFFGSDDRRVYAVKVLNGRVAWRFEANGPVRSTPVVDDDGVYVGCEAGLVYGLSLGGDIRWRFNAKRGVMSSPALTEGMLYVGGRDGHVYALNVDSGWLAWRYRTEGPVISSPAVSEGVVFIGSADGTLYALDASEGRPLWRYETEGQVTSSPAVFAGSVYVGSVDGAVYSLDARTGNLRWRFETEGPVISSPTVEEGVVYVGSNDHHVYALPA